MKKFEEATIDVETIVVEDVITTSICSPELCDAFNENETDTDWD